MIRRLVEAHRARHQSNPSTEQVLFWLKEGRTAGLLREVGMVYPELLATANPFRPLLTLTGAHREADLDEALEAEEMHEREVDRAYWAPLKAELEQLRHKKS